jgi:hypothetical protein
LDVKAYRVKNVDSSLHPETETCQYSLLTQISIEAGCPFPKLIRLCFRLHLIPARRGATPRQAWLEPGHPASDYSSDIRHRSRLPQFPPSSDFGATRRVLVSA